MPEIINFPGNRKAAASHDIVRREEAVALVRKILKEVRLTEGFACQRMMDLGDALIPVREAAGYGGWGAFRKDCGLPERDAQIAMQLAKHRPEIEAENAKRASESKLPLSVRGALELIRPKAEPEDSAKGAPEKSGTTTPITVEVVLAWLRTASPEDKRRIAVALAQDTEAMRKILPAKALPAKATPKQIYDRALGLLSPDDAPAVH